MISIQRDFGLVEFEPSPMSATTFAADARLARPAGQAAAARCMDCEGGRTNCAN
jgi:hypothetical protein